MHWRARVENPSGNGCWTSRTTTGASSARTFRKSSSDGRSACPTVAHWDTACGKFSNLMDGKIGRVIFSIVEGEMVLLHGFVKKSQKAPPQEIDLALKRKRELE